MRCFCTNSTAQLPDECPIPVEVGWNMSSDKLSVAARAAGFAMAYDEAPVGTGVKALPVVPSPLSALRQEPKAQSTEMIVGKIGGSSGIWGLAGWSFWKTA